jgi:hypothetical protein
MVGDVTAHASFERCENHFGEWGSTGLTIASARADRESRR